jgi:glycosyltransferase 2 family protein
MTNLDGAEMRQRSRTVRIAVMALKLGVSVALFLFLFSRIDPGGLLAKMRGASLGWLAAAMGLYLVMILASAWRWRWLFAAQRLAVSGRKLVYSYLVATFFNNFLPSNIGGDVVRIRDTAREAGSRTLAATIVLIDRAIGLAGLLFVAALGASAARLSGTSEAVPVWPVVLWGGFAALSAALLLAVAHPRLTARLLAPARRLKSHWIDERLTRITSAFVRFGEAPAALLWCLAGGVVVQLVLVGFYAAVAQSIGIPIAVRHLAVLVPVSFVVQMLPVSVNGFGVREATFSYYFLRLGLPMDSALALSLLSTATVLAFSLSGAVVYATRR